MRLCAEGLRHSESPVILKNTSCSCSFLVNSSSRAWRWQTTRLFQRIPKNISGWGSPIMMMKDLTRPTVQLELQNENYAEIILHNIYTRSLTHELPDILDRLKQKQISLNGVIIAIFLTSFLCFCLFFKQSCPFCWRKCFVSCLFIPEPCT